VVIGTDPAQRTEDREQWIAAREAVVHVLEGLRFEASEEPHGYEEGLGWVAARSRAVITTETPSRRPFGRGEPRRRGVEARAHTHLRRRARRRSGRANEFKALVFNFGESTFHALRG